MILRQFLHIDPAAASFLVGCGAMASGAVIDPVGDPAVYIETAAGAGLGIRYVIDTYIHADHVSAGRALTAATGARHALFSAACVQQSLRGVSDGDVLELGNVTLEAMHAPGRPPKHISLLRRDTTRTSAPWMIFWRRIRNWLLKSISKCFYGGRNKTGCLHVPQVQIGI